MADGMPEPPRPALPTLSSDMVASVDKKLRGFAFTLAVIEKAASTLGTMNFIWATVVLLGGFSQYLESVDFWYVSILLTVEGLRILCRRGELATQLSGFSDFNFSNFNFSNFRLSSLNFFNFSLSLIHLYSLVIQEFSAAACFGLSGIRLSKRSYGTERNLNRDRALTLFYSLSIAESCLTVIGFILRSSRSSFFLVSRRTNNMASLLVGESVYSALRRDGFADAKLNMFERYFYDIYCRCINGSVFDSLKVDFLSYSVELLQNIDHNEQLNGARLLSLLLKSKSLDSEKLSVIRTMPGVLERLIELLNWEEPQEREIREVAGNIICKLVEIPRHRIRVMAIPESLQSITSLLRDPDQIADRNSPTLTMLGKGILKFLAKDPDNRDKIGGNTGVRHKIIALHGLNPNAPVAEIISHLESADGDAARPIGRP